MNAPLPENEAERLAVLRDLRILDTAPEPAFDELVALAAEICQTPVALVSSALIRVCSASCLRKRSCATT